MEVPKTIGKYEILGRLGKGGMAEVFLARKTGAAGFEKKMALKRLPTDQLDDKILIKSLINEAMLAAQLSHANLVQVFEFELIDDDYCLVMEYVDGVTLDTVLQRCRALDLPIPQGLVVYLALEVGAGLDYAHTARSEAGDPLGLVHRDIKPSNIMITRRGQVKIMDFGIARAATNPYKTTQSGGVKGTLAYMSPEQLSGDDNLGPQSDLFSLGVVLYEVATLQRLLDDSNLLMLAKNLLEGLRPDARERLNICFPALVPIVSRLLETSPAERYPDARSMLLELRQISTGTSAIDMADFVADLGASGGGDESAGTIPSSGRHPRPSTGDALFSDTYRSGGVSSPIAGGTAPIGRPVVLPPTVASGESSASLVDVGTASTRASETGAGGCAEIRAEVPVSAVRETLEPVSSPKGQRVKFLLAATVVLALLAGWGISRYLSPSGGQEGPAAGTEAGTGRLVGASEAREGSADVGLVPSPEADKTPVLELAALPSNERSGQARGDETTENGEIPTGETVTVAGGDETSQMGASHKKKRARAPKPTGRAATEGGGENASAGPAAGPEGPMPVQESKPGFLVINSMPWSIVYLNGEKRGQVPLRESVTPGTYDVRLESEDGRKKQFKVEVGPGAHVTKVWLFDDNNWME